MGSSLTIVILVECR